MKVQIITTRYRVMKVQIITTISTLWKQCRFPKSSQSNYLGNINDVLFSVFLSKKYQRFTQCITTCALVRHSLRSETSYDIKYKLQVTIVQSNSTVQ